MSSPQPGRVRVGRLSDDASKRLEAMIAQRGLEGVAREIGTSWVTLDRLRYGGTTRADVAEMVEEWLCGW